VWGVSENSNRGDSSEECSAKGPLILSMVRGYVIWGDMCMCCVSKVVCVILSWGGWCSTSGGSCSPRSLERVGGIAIT
jgi:hypothetical protein